MAFNLEDKIRWEELAPSLQAFLKKLQKMIEDEIARAKSAEKKLSDRIDKIWGSDGENSSHDITEIWKKLGEIGGAVDGLKDTVNKNVTIVVGSYGDSPEAEIPWDKKYPNSMGEWLINPNGEFGEFRVYRHAQITTTGDDVTWSSLNGSKNVKYCQAEDNIFLSYGAQLKEYYVSVPTSLCLIYTLSVAGSLIKTSGKTWESNINAPNGGSISTYSAVAYTDLTVGSDLAKNIPSLNGNLVNIYRVVQTKPEYVTLSIPNGYTILLDDYRKNRVYSASEIIQHCQLNAEGAGGWTTSKLPIKFLDDTKWISLIHFAATEAELRAKLP